MSEFFQFRRDRASTASRVSSRSGLALVPMMATPVSWHEHDGDPMTLYSRPVRLAEISRTAVYTNARDTLGRARAALLRRCRVLAFRLCSVLRHVSDPIEERR